MVAWWDAQTWISAGSLASYTRGFYEVEKDCRFSKILFPFPRPWINSLATRFGIGHRIFNFAFIFVFGFAIAAAEERGLKDYLQRGRWFYLVVGCILSGIKSGISVFKLQESLKDGEYKVIKGTTR